MNKKTLLIMLTLLSVSYLQTQAQPGRRMNPDDMVQREKQNLYSKVENLSEDQIMIIDGIYEEFAQSMQETFQEVRKSGNREEMRPKMEALNKEKDGLMFDILSEEQYTIYEELTKAQRERMKERQGNRQPNEGVQ
ncbi:hypothetical protein N7E81_17695 [Reichenbachiella carrageenanivorans]|uniref:LTXXQ motif family protein n=1 Tax=Reichenbachiella carrageenanivorans TaxID=2979869 RepID=A0ABY6D5R3_9BACT|nr:hypothetical protein [Reichenbachiella carrageenanivorans]UXX79190.1 hypothetical protein N7E81_17695 [Reichenbachiella carrageenanivorans]